MGRARVGSRAGSQRAQWGSLVAIWLLTGCANFVVVETGHGATGLLSKPLSETKAEITESAILLGWRFNVAGAGLDLGVGPQTVTFTNHSGAIGSGAKATARLRAMTEFPVQPYVAIGAGVIYFDRRLEPQATNWGFTLQGGIGISGKVSDSVLYHTEYRLWHESNGSALFGSPRPNPGFNADGVYFGMEFKL